MTLVKDIGMAVLATCLAGAVYYMTADKPEEGAIIVLLGILYFVGVPKVIDVGD